MSKEKFLKDTRFEIQKRNHQSKEIWEGAQAKKYSKLRKGEYCLMAKVTLTQRLCSSCSLLNQHHLVQNLIYDKCSGAQRRINENLGCVWELYESD